MAEIADGILNGDFDEQTGEWLGEGQGFPRSRYAHTPKKDKRSQNKKSITQELDNLRKQGYEIKSFTPYQHRINGALDLYNVSRKWHNIKTQQRGTYRDYQEIVKQQLDITPSSK